MEARGSGATAAEAMRCVGPLCSVAGLAIGFGGADMVGQAPASAVVAVLFVLSNTVPDTADSSTVLGLVCSLLGAALGFGFAAVLRAGRTLFLDGTWSRETTSPLRVPLFLIFVTIFHFAEFAFTTLFHPQDVSYRAFLLTPVQPKLACWKPIKDHEQIEQVPMGAYSIAMVAALTEFWLEELLHSPTRLIVPEALSAALLVGGAILCFGGWILRTMALFTAQSNFTHLVAWQKSPTHTLVRHGVYRLFRHPGYVGWFLWSVSTQVVLGNVFCFFAYAMVAWRFFAGRIPSEEAMLVGFFGEEYIQYAEEVPCGIPWISTLP